MKLNEILCRQLSIDYCCKADDVLDDRNHFTIHQFLPDRRKFQEGKECFLKIAVINGKLLFSGRKDILDWCQDRYPSAGSEWFFEAKNPAKLPVNPEWVQNRATVKLYQTYEDDGQTGVRYPADLCEEGRIKMKQIKNAQYEEFQKYLHDKNNGRILTPDGLRFICQANDYDPEKIGRHMLETLAKLQTQQ